MAAATTKGHGGGVAPTSSDKLEDQAATAALYVTKDKGKSSHSVPDEDAKLSSASAAASLKYAKPQALPSLPSPGLQISSAGAAASIADTNKKSIEPWKPGPIPAAEKAAYRAKDYEAYPLWKPEKSTAGSRAAFVASDKRLSANVPKARESDDGHSAAESAARRKMAPPIDHRAMPDDASRKALMAATGAMASSRRRAGSAPTAPIISPAGASMRTGIPSSTDWAMKAAAQSQRARPPGVPTDSRDHGWEAAKVQNIAQVNVSRQMYTSHPPVSPEVEERNRQDTLRASAVAMAQKMYSIQEKAIEKAKVDIAGTDSHHAARNVHNRRTSDASIHAGTPEASASPLYSNSLQEAAQRLAQERLAKMRDEREEYQNYYGQKAPTRSRLSMHSKLRRRASSDGAADKDDEEQSRKIRSQMSRFRNNVLAADDKQRDQDRNALLAAAQRNVKASMHSMDEEVFQETGKSSPAQQEAWAAKAREKAQADSDARQENFGKVHIGAGKYIDQEEVDTVAKNRLQPTLDDINEKAETKRAHEMEAKLERGEEKRQAELEKQRTVELKTEEKKARDEEKQKQKDRKAEEKKTHKEELAVAKEKEKAEKEELRAGAKSEKSKETPQAEDDQENEVGAKGKGKGKGILSTLRISTHGGSTSAARKDDQPVLPQAQDGANESLRDSNGSSVKDSSDVEEPRRTSKSMEDDMVASPTSPSKGHSRVKSWFAERFRRSSKGMRDEDDGEQRKAGFLGNADSSNAGADEDVSREASMRDVAMAGRPIQNESAAQSQPDRSVSPISDSQDRRTAENVSISSASDHGEATSTPAGNKDTNRRGRMRLKKIFPGNANIQSSGETNDDKNDKNDDDDNNDNDEFVEARDVVNNNLEPPPKLTPNTVTSKASASPVRDSRFSEDL